ncbi:MAG TPA: sugar transferase [Prolixibacteraceae bacterium]|jgi:exopolysaccharide biosynthesis polyprenyl glycosylphosphotransferase
MLKEREPILAKLSIVFQVLMTIACFYAAIWIIENFIKPISNNYNQYNIISFLIIPLWLLILDQFNLGHIGRFKMYSTLFVEYLTAIFVGNILLYTTIVVLNLHSVSRLVLATFALLNLTVLYSFKFILSATMKFVRRKGLNSRYILIIADKDSDYFIDRLIEVKDWGYRIWAIMSDDQFIKTKYDPQYTVLPYEHELSPIIDEKAIDEVIYCKSTFDQNEIQRFIYSCAEVGVVFRMQSQLLSCVKMQSTLSFLNQMPFLTFRNTPDNYLALKVKVFIDYALSLFILIVLSPFMLLIAILIKLDGGPVFFLQKRMGLHGRRFVCLKFRTMVVDAEKMQASLISKNEQEGPVFKIKNDPRVTRIGQFLRKTSLDELPQFINVLKGEMAIVGPRPPIPSEVKQYKRWQNRRLSMKPGITCIWQVSGRNNIPFEQWMKLDMQYIDTWSLKLDLIIVLKTIKVVFTGDGQ